MRIWSLHPKHFDSKGLVALWRETLLAKHVLEGKTKGYVNHPQLNRFKNQKDPLGAINHYLMIIHDEATLRGYKFDSNKFLVSSTKIKITVTSGQLNYEIEHLQGKLKRRDQNKFKENLRGKKYSLHPIFRLINGDIEDWEIIR